ncbi:MAG: hypothetical protein HeimC3_28060 [Candidatus Heimdallarchaeota archaeon LC_3]|nr:MAG: hypothetical protein HeimC3_28060 [Candidatus Heimdallarchaeota archaeon LC_3]
MDNRLTFDEELEEAIGDPLKNYLINTFDIYKETLGVGLFMSRNPDLTSVERLSHIIGLYERYIRSSIDLLHMFSKSEHLEVLKATNRLNILHFAQYFVHAATQEDLKVCKDKVLSIYKNDPVILDGVAKFFDCVVYLQLLEQSKSTKSLETQKTNAIRKFLTSHMKQSSGDITIVEAERAVKVYFEEKRVKNIQKIIKDFRDKVYEWNIVRKIPENDFVNWLIEKEIEISSSDSQQIYTGSGKKLPSAFDGIITIVYQDQAGERKYIGEASSRALNAGLFQAIRPGEIIRQFGINLKSIEFTITDPAFPSWIWLNHETQETKASENAPVQESSIFAIIGKEPNIRYLEGIHNLIHKILLGKEKRLPGSGDDLVKQTIFNMLEEVLIYEKTAATKLFEDGGVFSINQNIQTASFEPFFLLNFKLLKQRHKLGWDTIEVWGKGKISREAFSTSGYPWILDSTNRFKDVLIDLFARRLQGEVFMKKSSFVLGGQTYFTISDVNPDTLRARIIVFRSDPDGSLNYVDIRRRYDLFVTQPADKFGFKEILPEMNAQETQLVLDKLAFT